VHHRLANCASYQGSSEDETVEVIITLCLFFPRWIFLPF